MTTILCVVLAGAEPVLHGESTGETASTALQPQAADLPKTGPARQLVRPAQFWHARQESPGRSTPPHGQRVRPARWNPSDGATCRNSGSGNRCSEPSG